MKKLIPFTLFLFSYINTFCNQLPTFVIENKPKWKTDIQLSISNIDFSDKGQISYLLLDFQQNEQIKEYSYRYCYRMNNEQGVKENSLIYINFDPSYEKLAINKVVLHRDGEDINKLDYKKVDIFRNEENADRLIYDGTYSAMIIVDDVRVGDVLEYEYTLKGSNPLFKDFFYWNVQQAYTQEVFQIYREIRIPKKYEIKTKSVSNGIPPEIIEKQETTNLVWDIKNVDAKFIDSDIPSWHNAYPSFEITNFKNWNQVRNFSKKLYRFDIETPHLDKWLKDQQFTNTQKDIVNIIRFVQNDIRYLGLESGIHSHMPHNPDQVLKQRFGDCKDKSYLLSIILRKIGLKAWPAYVNTKHKKHTNLYVESPFAFNHAIVKFIFQDKIYWIDPTHSFYGGTLENYCSPRFGKTLVLDDSESDSLEQIPLKGIGSVKIVEDYWFIDSISDVLYTVKSTYRDRMANIKRQYHFNNSLAENKNSYLNFCSNYYPNLRWRNDTSLIITDEKDKNILEVKEEYYVPNLWTKSGIDSVELYATIYPYNLYEYLSYSNDQVRSMPMFVFHPIDTELTINLHYPKYKKLGFSSEKDSVINDSYRFSYNSYLDQRNHTYTINYKYRSLKDHVNVNETKKYFEDYNRLSELCEEYIQWGINNPGLFKWFKPSIFISLCFLMLIFGFARKLYKIDYASTNSPLPPKKFGGWLILPIIGLYITPIAISYQVYNIGYYNHSLWNSFLQLSPNQPFTIGSIFFFELLFNISLIFFSIFLIILLHQKRSSFPRIYIWFRLFSVVGVILDVVMSSYFLSMDIDSDDIRNITSEIIGSAIWIPYFLYSERVKQTFTKTLYSSQNNIE